MVGRLISTNPKYRSPSPCHTQVDSCVVSTGGPMYGNYTATPLSSAPPLPSSRSRPSGLRPAGGRGVPSACVRRLFLPAPLSSHLRLPKPDNSPLVPSPKKFERPGYPLPRPPSNPLGDPVIIGRWATFQKQEKLIPRSCKCQPRNVSKCS